MFFCPVCGYPGWPDAPPNEYDICPSCGTEFGYHDVLKTHSQLRSKWIAAGPVWQSRVVARPYDWDAWKQMEIAGLVPVVPSYEWSAWSSPPIERYTSEWRTA